MKINQKIYWPQKKEQYRRRNERKDEKLKENIQTKEKIYRNEECWTRKTEICKRKWMTKWKSSAIITMENKKKYCAMDTKRIKIDFNWRNIIPYQSARFD